MKASNNICIHFYELEHRMLNQLEKNRDWDGIGAKYTQVQEDFGQRTPGMKKRNGANEIYSTPQAPPGFGLQHARAAAAILVCPLAAPSVERPQHLGRRPWPHAPALHPL